MSRALAVLLAASLAGCGSILGIDPGIPFSTADDGGDDAAAASSGDAGDARPASSGDASQPSPDGGAQVDAGGGRDAASSPDVAAGDEPTGDEPMQVDAGLCCSFPGDAGVAACEVGNPWLCSGAQTYSCAQAQDCAGGQVCYYTAGPFGGTVQPCP